MSVSRDLQVGDACFAKVKGFIPYPAVIQGRKSSGKNVKFSVLFFETKETANVGAESVWTVMPDTVKKFVTAKTLERKNFKHAFVEMEKYLEKVTEEIVIETFGVDREGEVGKLVESGGGKEEDFDEFHFEFNNLKSDKENLVKTAFVARRRCEQKMPDQEATVLEVETDSVSKTNTQDSSNDLLELEITEMPLNKDKSWVCDDCGAVFENNKAFTDHVLDHIINETLAPKTALSATKNSSNNAKEATKKKGSDVEDKTAKKSSKANPKKKENILAGVLEEGNSMEKEIKDQQSSLGLDLTSMETRKKKKANPKKKTKEKKNRRSKTLRESELDADKAFEEKIVIKDDKAFHCKLCPEFVTSVKLLARSHALSCGTKKKLGRRVKKKVCDECGGRC